MNLAGHELGAEYMLGGQQTHHTAAGMLRLQSLAPTCRCLCRCFLWCNVPTQHHICFPLVEVRHAHACV